MGFLDFLKKNTETGEQLTETAEKQQVVAASNGILTITFISYEKGIDSRCFDMCNESECRYVEAYTTFPTSSTDFKHSIVHLVIENTSGSIIRVEHEDIVAIDSCGFTCNTFRLCDKYTGQNTSGDIEIAPHAKVRFDALIYSCEDIRSVIYKNRENTIVLNLDGTENKSSSDIKDEIITSLKEKITELETEVERLKILNIEQRQSMSAQARRQVDKIKYIVEEDDEYYRIISQEENDTISFNREFDKSKGNYGWINADDPLITMRLDNTWTSVPTMIKSTVSGVFEFDTNKLIPFGKEICRIRKYPQERKQEIIETFEREEIKQAVFKKERKKQIERETLDELIQQGLVFNTYTKKDGNRMAIPMDVASAVWNRDGGKCCICGSKENLEFDHIIPISKGGATTFRNLQLLCQTCNIRKSDNI